MLKKNIHIAAIIFFLIFNLTTGFISNETMQMIEGGYAMVLVQENALYAFRDPLGIRPLVLGRLDEDEWVVASETCGLDIVGATFVREVRPGEIRLDY